jgi:hypothetical protein
VNVKCWIFFVACCECKMLIYICGLWCQCCVDIWLWFLVPLCSNDMPCTVFCICWSQDLEFVDRRPIRVQQDQHFWKIYEQLSTCCILGFYQCCAGLRDFGTVLVAADSGSPAFITKTLVNRSTVPDILYLVI